MCCKSNVWLNSTRTVCVYALCAYTHKFHISTLCTAGVVCSDLWPTFKTTRMKLINLCGGGEAIVSLRLRLFFLCVAWQARVYLYACILYCYIFQHCSFAHHTGSQHVNVNIWYSNCQYYLFVCVCLRHY